MSLKDVQVNRGSLSEITLSADSLTAKQPTPTAVPSADFSPITTEAAATTTTALRARQPIYLTTFKGKHGARCDEETSILPKGKSNNNNNNNNQDNTELQLTRNSLESITSKCSSSSANDDSQHQHATSTSSKPPTPDSFVDVQVVPNSRHTICSIAGSNPINLKGLYVGPPVLPSPTDEGVKTTNVGQQQQHHMSMMSLGSKLTGAKSSPYHQSVAHLSSSSSSSNSEKRPPGSGEGPRRPEDGNQQQRQEIKPPFKFAGVLASIAASVFFSLSFLCIKLMPDDSFQGKTQALLFRGIFMTLLCGVCIQIRGDGFLVKRDEIWVNFLRAMFGTFGVFSTFAALKYISLGDATALVFSSPIWTSLLSRAILKEPLHCFHLIALPLSIVGIILIAHPSLIISDEYLPMSGHGPPPALNASSSPVDSITALNSTLLGLQNFNSTGSYPEAQPLGMEPPHSVEPMAVEAADERWLGVLISLFTSFVVSGTYIVLKFRKSTPVQTTTFWFGFSILVFSLLTMCIIGPGEVPTLEELILYTCNGTTAWLAQIVLQWAFLHEKASILSVVRTLDVACTFTLSALFLDEDIYWTSIAGASIIVLVVICIIMNTWIMEWACMNRSRPSSDNNSHPPVPALSQHEKLQSYESKKSINRSSSYDIEQLSDTKSTTMAVGQIYRQTEARDHCKC